VTPGDAEAGEALQAQPQRRGRPPAVEPDSVSYDIHVVDGPAGRRLAAVQAQAILDVLIWWRRRTTGTGNDNPKRG
jgi:hypothetical protein